MVKPKHLRKWGQQGVSTYLGCAEVRRSGGRPAVRSGLIGTDGIRTCPASRRVCADPEAPAGDGQAPVCHPRNGEDVAVAPELDRADASRASSLEAVHVLDSATLVTSEMDTECLLGELHRRRIGFAHRFCGGRRARGFSGRSSKVAARRNQSNAHEQSGEDGGSHRSERSEDSALRHPPSPPCTSPRGRHPCSCTEPDSRVHAPPTGGRSWRYLPAAT
jgi:hypothetical protein